MNPNTSDRAFGVFSEYGQLRNVIVGIADNVALPPFGPELTHYRPELQRVLKATGGRKLVLAQAFPELWAKTQEQLNTIAQLYEHYGVNVRRPRQYSDIELDYLSELQPGHSLLYPADPVFVVGKHYLELCCRRAYRRKEVFPLRDAVAPLVGADKEARHVAMPQARPHLPAGDGPGPFLEGGDMIIYGRHVMVGEHHLTSNRAGIEWLQRYLSSFDWQVHAVPLQGEAMHLLGIICLVREGLLLAYLPALREGIPAPLKNWEVIELTLDEAMGMATVGVSIDEKRYVTSGSHGRVDDLLAAHGVEPIVVACDALERWGGSIRCCTLPLARDA
jgi:glycine amidinotransferase